MSNYVYGCITTAQIQQSAAELGEKLQGSLDNILVIGAILGAEKILWLLSDPHSAVKLIGDLFWMMTDNVWNIISLYNFEVSGIRLHQ